MASYDPGTKSVVVRIVYDGSGLAGKTRTLRWVSETFAARTGPLYVPAESASGRTLYFDWLELDGGHFVNEAGRAHPLRVELVTVPGQSAYVQRRYGLLRSCDAVISVLDSTPKGLRRAAPGLRFLHAALAELGSAAPPLVVQANKQDLPFAQSAASVRRALSIGADVDVVETSAATGAGVREALVKAIQRARGHVRGALGGRAPTWLAPNQSTPESLYRRMRAFEAVHADHLPGELLADRLLGEQLRA